MSDAEIGAKIPGPAALAAALVIPTAPTAAAPTPASRLRSWARVGMEFSVGQGAVQVLNLVTGFLLLRWLGVEDYALLSFGLACQAMLGTFLDLGNSGAISALVGSRISDRAVVSEQMVAALRLRTRLAILAVPPVVLSFWLLGAQQPWSAPGLAVVLAAAALGALGQSSMGVHSAPLLMHREIGRWYRIAGAAAMARLALISAFHATGALAGSVAAWIGAGSSTATAWACRRASRGRWVAGTRVSPEARAALLRHLGPQIPGAMFTAFQGQITLLLISWFGRTLEVAETAALGRVGQIFVALAAFNGVVLAPRMAALPAALVRSRYALVLAGAGALAATLVALAWLYPDPLLWLLGKNYDHLGSELRLMVAAASMHYVGSVMWSVHAARRWVYWWSSALFIGGTLAVQGAYLATHDLSSTASVMQFAVWSAVAALGVHAATAAYGIRREGRHP